MERTGKRKKYNKSKRQDCTERVNSEECRREDNVGLEVNVPPSNNEELNQVAEVESLVCSDGASTTPLSPTTSPSQPPATSSSPTPTPPPPRHNFPIFTSSKTQFKPRRKSKVKKVLSPPKFNYQKISSIFHPVRDESRAKVTRRSEDKPQLALELSLNHIPDEDICYSSMAKSRNLVG